MKFIMKSMLALTVCALMFTGCESTDVSSAPTADHSHMAAPTAAAPSTGARAVAVIYPTEGNSCNGTVEFIQTPAGVKVIAKIKGLGVSSTHAIHVHEFGDTTANDGTSAGGHYNPEGHDHALPESAMRHAGDLGNLSSDVDGNATYEILVNNITINGKKNPIIGRGVVIHAKPDDGGQPTGNAGPRIGVGTIGLAKSN